MRGPAFRTLSVHKQSSAIRAMFSAIAPRYDLLNHLLSANLDRCWRRRATRCLRLQAGAQVLDVCAGTGDLGFEILRTHPTLSRVIALDFSVPMLRLAAEKARRQSLMGQLLPACADALRLPFADEVFDATTCAFGVRNFERLDSGLQEMFRVTRPGGTLVMVEFFPSELRVPQRLFNLFFRYGLPAVGKLVSGHRYAYSYLPASVNTFVRKQEMKQLLREAGCSEVQWVDLSGGVATLFVASKPGGSQ